MFSFLKQKLFKYVLYPLMRWYWKIFSPYTRGSRALIFFEDQILLVKNLNLPYWTMPGGGIEKGETPEACLVRELKEELDISIETIEYKLGEYTSRLENKHDEIHIFVVRLPSPHFAKQWELSDAQWFPRNNLPSDLSPATRRRLEECDTGEKNVISVW